MIIQGNEEVIDDDTILLSTSKDTSLGVYESFFKYTQN